jgi:hypothetical protein
MRERAKEMTMVRQSSWATLVVAMSLGACSKGLESSTPFGAGWVGSADGADDDGEEEDSTTGEGETDERGDDRADSDDPPKPTTGGGDAPVGSCCQGNDTPGCDDGVVAACVCAHDEFCCENVWDDLCAALVDDKGCGQCGAANPDEPGTSTSGGDDSGGDPSTSGGSSGGDSGGGDGGGEMPGVGDCCEANGTPGCEDAALQSCVCASDAYCCTNEWDNVCAGGVEMFGCGSCNEQEEGPGDCCAAKQGAGCSNAGIESCVCAQDPYCCSTTWDALCASEVTSFGCGTC